MSEHHEGGRATATPPEGVRAEGRGEAHGEGHPEARRHAGDALMQVRASDLEPYIGLRYLSKLFRVMAILVVLVLLAEIVTSLLYAGTSAIPTLLGEASRLIVAAGLLWGTGDLAILLIDIGHDVRATRILTGRRTAHDMIEHHAPQEHHHELHQEHQRDQAAGRRREGPPQPSA